MKKTGKDVEDRIAVLYAEGMSGNMIAATVGVSKPTAQKIIRRLVADGVIELHVAPPPPPDEEVGALRAKGMTGAQIAAKIGFSEGYIYTVIRRLEDDGTVEHSDIRAEHRIRVKRNSKDTPPVVRALLRHVRSGESLTSLTVLRDGGDPFRVDTPSKKAAGQWLADAIADLDALRGDQRVWWNRGLHYAVLGRIKPDGKPYANTQKDWEWMDSVASKAARWSGLVAFDRIQDRKNNAPTLQPVEEIDPERVLQHNLDDDDVDLWPSTWLTGFVAMQPYRIALVAEKSSAGDVLRPLSVRYHTDLLLPDGEMTDTMIHRMAQAADADGRPLVVIYFADGDPSGYQMPISVSRKLQAFQAIEFPDLEFRVVQAAMLPEQVREFNLPESPLKDEEKRGEKWTEAFGLAQTELDSLTSLQPELFEQIAVEAIEQFYDSDLAREAERLRTLWDEAAQAARGRTGVRRRTAATSQRGLDRDQRAARQD